ncbi:hypothetical protein J2X16_000578 [Pelomonas aquatica]|uniref:Haem-binding uptake Tiki superfamily ChaN domain-containing protein n=1 Tax=Pelomonas aquatica TaxID=431058 RepID=A0ABU1Z3R4_9BURK|nr:hypothetical protein [Pelomonas aquatica]MDR7295257.1 hypothetical protein [Pelomonas aquatica]
MRTLLLLALLPTLVAAACPDDAGFKKLASFEHLYLGEAHGTQEVPQLVQCLVQSAIAAKPTSLAVSLEMPEDARQPDSWQWRSQDGRASQAMWQLHQWLQAQEAAGALKLHHHQPTGSYPDQADYEKAAGLSLNALMRQNARVIVLGGNFHSRREPIEWMPKVRPMGTYVGEGTVHVDLQALEGGTAWNCTSRSTGNAPPPPPTCAANTQLAVPRGDARVGDLISGREFGHDYVYLMKSFTASPPLKQPQ